MTKDLISVIVPIYNAEDYLKMCVEKILKQTYKNIEILLIDDGSTDGSLNLCKQLSNKDERIKVFHKKNSGIGKTRDYGIKKASGNYIAFIDSDDFVSGDYIEYLYNLLKENGADVSQCGHYELYDFKYKELINSDQMKVFSGLEAIIDMLYEKNIDSSFWGKLIKKNLFENLNFGVYKKFEDFDLIYKIFDKCDRIVYGNQRKYYYSIRLNSLMNEKFSDDNVVILEILDNLAKYFDNCDNNMKKAIEHRKICADFYIMRNCKKNTELYLKVKQDIKTIRKSVLMDKKASKKAKVASFLSYFSYSVTNILFKIRKKITALDIKKNGKKIEM